jgi:hypothetical protein
MPEAINFLQSFFTFNSFSSIGASRHEIRLANALKKDARKYAAEAAAEARNAETAQMLTLEGKEKSASRSLAEIAIWHHELSLKKYRRAAARYAEAAKIRTKKQKEFDATAREMTLLAAKSESAVRALSEFIKQS